jgi:hypothetical protein
MKQCPAIHPTRGGAVFCTKKAGHAGEHRGFRKRWTGEAERVVPLVAITLVVRNEKSNSSSGGRP